MKNYLLLARDVNFRKLLTGGLLAIMLSVGSPDLAGAVVNGSDSDISNAPWQVALLYSDAPNDFQGQFCGGSLISTRWVLTAAHCVDDLNESDLQILAGVSFLSDETLTGAAVSKIIVHPNWNPITKSNDLALIEVVQPFTLSSGMIETISVPSKASQAELSARISGWGSTQRTPGSGVPPSYPQSLQTAQVLTKTSSYCQAALAAAFNSITMMCATVDAFSIDTCQGDSGGPLAISNRGRFELVGITSWGYGCAWTSPGVYTKVSNYYSWITTNAVSGPEIEPATPSEIVRASRINIAGSGFSTSIRSNTVKIGAASAKVISATTTSLLIEVPSRANLGATELTVRVGNLVATKDVTVFAAHTISSISPATLSVGSELTISGTNFSTTNGDQQVVFSGTNSAADIISATSVALTVVVPSGALTGKVSVTLRGLTVQSPQSLSIGSPPVIDGLSSASVSRNQSLTISGSGFASRTGSNRVQIGGQSARVTAATATSLTVRVPSRASTGSTSVTVTIDGFTSNQWAITILK